MRKTYWILIIFGAVLLPLGLNWLILQPSKFEVVGDGTHWLSFWATYISAVATFVMVVITWRTLQQNKEQVNELKRQWNEQNRAEVIFSVEYVNCFYCLKIQNAGNKTAYNVRFSINEEFLDKVFVENFRDTLSELGSVGLIIPPAESRLYIISFAKPTSKGSMTVGDVTYKNCEFSELVDALYVEPMIIKGKYGNNIKIEETISIKQYIKGLFIEKNEVALKLENIYDVYKFVNEVPEADPSTCECNKDGGCVYAKNED